jgi:uncharacterized phage protein gp47/JayE
MNFQKDFDELLDDILTDYKNQFPEADTSQGSLIYIKSACVASALWGLYKYQEYISKQIFPDTADTENLDHHAWVRGLTRNPSESDSDLLARLLDYIRRPPAGGNQYDYVKWALEITNVEAAYCYPIAQGLGTVDVVILSDTSTGSEVPSSYSTLEGTTTAVQTGKLIDGAAGFSTSGVMIGDIVKNSTLGTETTVTAVDNDTALTISSDIFTASGQNYSLTSLVTQVKEHIDDVRPVAASVVRVLAPTILPQDVEMTVVGDVNKTQIHDEIEAYLSFFEPGQKLFRSQLIAIAISYGAEDVTLDVPAADVVPLPTYPYEMVRPGSISVT